MGLGISSLAHGTLNSTGTSLKIITVSCMCQNGLYTARGSKNSRIEHRELLFNSAAAMCAKKMS